LDLCRDSLRQRAVGVAVGLVLTGKKQGRLDPFFLQHAGIVEVRGKHADGTCRGGLGHGDVVRRARQGVARGMRVAAYDGEGRLAQIPEVVGALETTRHFAAVGGVHKHDAHDPRVVFRRLRHTRNIIISGVPVAAPVDAVQQRAANIDHGHPGVLRHGLARGLKRLFLRAILQRRAVRVPEERRKCRVNQQRAIVEAVGNVNLGHRRYPRRR